MQAWVDANTSEVLEILDTYWCRDCATHPENLLSAEECTEDCVNREEILDKVKEVEAYLNANYGGERYTSEEWMYCDGTLRSAKDVTMAFASLPSFVRELQKTVQARRIANYAAMRELSELVRPKNPAL